MSNGWEKITRWISASPKKNRCSIGCIDSDDHGAHLRSVDGIADRVEVLPDRLLLYTRDGEAAHSEVIRRELGPLSALVRRSTLEDVFLHLTGRTLVD